MLESLRRYATTIAEDPIEALFRLRTRAVAIRARGQPACRYAVNGDWGERLHHGLGHSVPCETAAEFWPLWRAVTAELRDGGLRVGPESFGIWNDGEPEMVRAIWCLVRHLSPAQVVETGVAHGVTSRFILEAMARNGNGHLWSIDLPPAFARERRDEIGVAVPERLKSRWSYVAGSSRRRLPALLAGLGAIDLFIHDSMHTDDNVGFEMRRAWGALRSGGVIVVDDIDLNSAFRDVTAALPWRLALICQAEPLSPDRRRFDAKGLFGLAIKA